MREGLGFGILALTKFEKLGQRWLRVRSKGRKRENKRERERENKHMK